MKPVTLFYQPRCPFCKKALGYLEELQRQEPYSRVSYQYVKCVMTSKVNPDGATITDVLDVNVGEVEVSYWEFK